MANRLGQFAVIAGWIAVAMMNTASLVCGGEHENAQRRELAQLINTGCRSEAKMGREAVAGRDMGTPKEVAEGVTARGIESSGSSAAAMKEAEIREIAIIEFAYRNPTVTASQLAGAAYRACMQRAPKIP
jgi:hypothetical protein